MVSRRRSLGLVAGILSTTAGCLNNSPKNRSDTSTPSATESNSSTESNNDVNDGSVTTPEDVPDWVPKWSLSFNDADVYSLDAGDERVLATVDRSNAESQTTAIVAIDPGKRAIAWETESKGAPVHGSHASFVENGNDSYGVTLHEDTVYTVTGLAEAREWSALRALDQTTGERDWSFKRQRKLAVAGVSNGLVVATGLEFFPPSGETETSHAKSDTPLSTVVFGLDESNGEVRWTNEYESVKDVAVGPAGIYVAVGDHLEGLRYDGESQFTYRQGPARRVEASSEGIYYLSGKGTNKTLHGLTRSGNRRWKRSVAVEELLLDDDRLYAGGKEVVAIESDGTIDWRDDDYGRRLRLSPDDETLYSLSGSGVSAYATEGDKRWTFYPTSNTVWPAAVTPDALVVRSVDPDSSPKSAAYAVNAAGQATGVFGSRSMPDVTALDGAVYVANGLSELVALES